MFGCARRIGCLAVLAIGVALFLTRDTWRPAAATTFHFAEHVTGHDDAATADTVATWQHLTQPAAARGEQAVRTLAAQRGPVYVNVRPGDLASYAFLSLADALPPALRDAQTKVVGDRVYLRTEVAPRDFAGLLATPVGALLYQRDTLQLGGTFDVVRPGLAQFRVQDVRIGAVPIPAAVIPTIVHRFRDGTPPAGISRDGIPVPLPEYIGDVRIGRGHITLYKATP